MGCAGHLVVEFITWKCLKYFIGLQFPFTSLPGYHVFIFGSLLIHALQIPWNVIESKFPTTVHTASSSPCFRFGNIWVTLATPPPSWETTTGFFHQNMVIDSFEILLPKRLQHTLKHIPHVSQPQSEWCYHWLQKCFLEKNIYHKAAPAVVQGPMVGSWRDPLLAPSAYETKIWDDAPHAD